MTLEAPFEFDAEQSALALEAAWHAEQFERVQAVRAEMARLEAREIRILAGLVESAEVDAAEVVVDEGRCGALAREHDLRVRSIATELAATLRVSIQAAEQRLAEAWTLTRVLRGTLAALEAGEISRAHAHELIIETEHLTTGRFEAEAALLPWAKRLAVAPFRRKAKQILETLEKESLTKRHKRAIARRRVDITAARDGMAHLDAYIDGADAALLKVGLENAAREAREHGDPRTVAQLQADFVVELLLEGKVCGGGHPGEGGFRCSGAAQPGSSVRQRAAVSVDVLIPAATLAGRNDEPAVIPGFGAIDPARSRELVALAPSLRRILTDPITGAVLDFDRKTYRVPAELKRVLRLRDGHCRAPGCSAPLEYCELDHTQGYARGGTTALWQLAHLCANHHHLKHEAGWSLKQHLDGVLEWRGPSGRRYRTHPELQLPVPAPPPPPPAHEEPAPFDAPPRQKRSGAATDGAPPPNADPSSGRAGSTAAVRPRRSRRRWGNRPR
jgi:hypothetical protein